MKKRSLREHIRYWFDCMMSKGTAAMSILLFAITVVIVGVIGIVAFLSLMTAASSIRSGAV